MTDHRKRRRKAEIRAPIDPEHGALVVYAHSYVNEAGEVVWVKDLLELPDDFDSKMKRLRDADRGRKARAAHDDRTEKAAAARRGDTKADPASVRAAVAARMQRYPRLSRTEACRRIAPGFGISVATALRYTRPK